MNRSERRTYDQSVRKLEANNNEQVVRTTKQARQADDLPKADRGPFLLIFFICVIGFLFGAWLIWSFVTP